MLYGFVLSFSGVLPPGIININTAIISVEKGTSKGVVFALGACLVVVFQVLISVLIAKHINMDDSVILMFEKIAVFIFFVLAVYFFLCAKKPPKRKPIAENLNRKAFLKGAFFSAINFFPLPYYIGWSKWLNFRGKFEFTNLNIALFIFAVILGTFIANYLYIIFFRRYKANPDKFSKRANYALSILTFSIAVFVLVKVNL